MIIYAVLYETVTAPYGFDHVFYGCETPDYFLPQRAHITEPEVVHVYCKNPRFNAEGRLCKSCRYKKVDVDPYDITYVSANGEFFVTEEEARTRYLQLKTRYNEQESAITPLRDESKKLTLESLASFWVAAQRLPQDVSPETPRVLDSDFELQVQFSPRELKLLALAFPEETWDWCKFHVEYYPTNLREFDPQSFARYNREKIQTLTESLSRVADFMETHADSIRLMFGSLAGSVSDC